MSQAYEFKDRLMLFVEPNVCRGGSVKWKRR